MNMKNMKVGTRGKAAAALFAAITTTVIIEMIMHGFWMAVLVSVLAGIIVTSLNSIVKGGSGEKEDKITIYINIKIGKKDRSTWKTRVTRVKRWVREMLRNITGHIRGAVMLLRLLRHVPFRR